MSMSLNSTSAEEIRSLERRVASDPAGLVFARLADAYRKAGLLTRALEVVERGLHRHPDYLNARLVRARVLRDLGHRAHAASAFQAVLEIDASNQVALRALGDLAGETGDFGAARKWYARLLEAEPFAEGPVRAILDRLPDSAEAPSPSPVAVRRDRDRERRVAGGAGTAGPEAASAPDAASKTASDGSTAPEAAAVRARESAESADERASEPSEAAEGEPVERAARTELEPIEPAKDAERVRAEVAAKAEPGPVEATKETGPEPAEAPLEEPMEEMKADGEGIAGEPRETAGDAVSEAGAQEVHAAEKEVPVESLEESTGELMTPTLADLYLQQGLFDEAIRIYERLMLRRPDDLGLAERLEVARTRAARRRGTPKGTPRAAASEEAEDTARATSEEPPRGPSIRRYLNDLIEGRPGEGSPPAGRGARFQRWLGSVRGA